MPFFMAGFEIAAYGSSESGIELERGLEEFNVAAVKLVEEAREITEELCTIEVDPSGATAASGWAGAAGGAEAFFATGFKGTCTESKFRRCGRRRSIMRVVLRTFDMGLFRML